VSRKIPFLTKVFFGSLIGVLLLGLIFSSYALFIQESNEYLGYVQISPQPYQIAAMLLMALFFGVKLSGAVVRPSDLFVHVYFIFILMPFSVLAGMGGEIPAASYFFGLFYLSGPLIIVYLICNLRFNFNFSIGFIAERIIILLLILLSLMSIVLLVFSGIEQASLGIESTYDRRLEGRDRFQVGEVKSYLLSMGSNAIAPTIAFIAGYRARFFLLLISASIVSIFYFYLGLKAPIFFMLVGFSLGLFFRRNGASKAGRQFTALILTAFFCFNFELLISDYSFIGDYFLRRAFVVPAYLNQIYLEIISDSFGPWRPWFGVITDLPITMYVGNHLGDPTLNANTNTFLYALLGNGFGAYFFHILIVALVLWYCDLKYMECRNGIWMWIAFLFSLLVIEQSVTTVLLSSGIALLILIFSLEKGLKNNL
jgi:hypothetical protein